MPAEEKRQDLPAPWEGLEPWEKAKAWKKTDPEIADKIIQIAEEEARFRRQLEIESAAHRRKLDDRLWITQLIGLIGCLVCLTTIAIRSADASGLSTALTLLGAGGTLSAGTLATGRYISKRVANTPGDTTTAAGESNAK